MLINEVETKVGLSKKAIRFYESAGLITPVRDGSSYRIYNEEDAHKLKVIKFLRELDVPIKEIQDLDKGIYTLENCLKERIKKIDEAEKNIVKVRAMCEEIIKNGDDFRHLEINKYLKEINVMNKKGFSMKKDIYNHNGKIMGAILSAVLSSLFFGVIMFIPLCIIFMAFLGHIIEQKFDLEAIIFGLLLVFVGLLFYAIFKNLFLRIKEIKSGEEDIASKY